MEPGINLTPELPSVLPTLLTSSEKSTYREMIGSLLYLSTMMRLDITYTISTLSQYLDSPHSTHLEAVKQIFRYLINTKHLQLVLGGSCLTDTNTTSGILGFLDADWASQLHCHSISRFAFFIGVGAISWSAKKQPIITLSSTESEYITLTHATKDILWIHKLLDELIFLYNHQLPSQFYKELSSTQKTPTSMHKQSTSTCISISFAKPSTMDTFMSTTSQPTIWWQISS